jgi:hypothetical protein
VTKVAFEGCSALPSPMTVFQSEKCGSESTLGEKVPVDG